MGRYLAEHDAELSSLPCAEASFSQLKAAGSGMAQQILTLLAEQPLYSHEIARKLEVHEQKIYYHMRKLEAAGLIVVERREEISGASAKYYKLAAPAFAVLLEQPRATGAITAIKPTHKAFLEPFIHEGRADFLIVIGSPMAHGPQMVQARDGGYGIDLALFLGSFLAGQPQPVVKLDTEFSKEDWNKNLIVIGGPIVNTVAAKINASMPLQFMEDGKTITSTITGTSYESDQIGLIAKGQNPKAEDKAVLFIAGRRQPGTKAAILAFLQHFDELIQGNAQNTNIMARIVEGKDLDSDGVVDAVSFRE